MDGVVWVGGWECGWGSVGGGSVGGIVWVGGWECGWGSVGGGVG